MVFKTEELDAGSLYQLLVGGVLPRPIAWVSTYDAQGVDNLAPYSFFTVASCQPPVLSITHVTPGDGRTKDTLANIQQTGECVVNIVSADHAEKMNASCADYSKDISEFKAVGVESVESLLVTAKGVKSSKVRYECRLREVIEVSDQPVGGTLILLDVVAVQVSDSVYENNRIDSAALDVIGKMGGNDYCSTEFLFSLERPILKGGKS